MSEIQSEQSQRIQYQSRLLKLKDKYIELLGQSEANFAVFCSVHGYTADENLVVQAKELREEMEKIEALLSEKK